MQDPSMYPSQDPWDPSTGCQACCSGEPFPDPTLNSVSSVDSF